MTRTGSSHRALFLVVFVVGAASLGSEIAAARLMAPFFGASTIVWANTIGIVLVALSIGYWLGGHLADRNPTMRGLSRLILVAGLALGLVPFAAQPFLNVSVEALDQVEAGAFLGSLLAVTILVAPAIVLLGTVAPYAVRLAIDNVDTSGAITGRLYAVSTMGSLSGTFLSALLLIPLVGTQRTFLIFALSCALVALPFAARRYAVLVPVTIVGLLALPVGAIKAQTTGRVLVEKETEYQYARVVQQPNGDRVLELNEGQAIHSKLVPHSYLTGGYWDEFLVAPLMGDRPLRRVAILGSGAGTTARAYAYYFPETEIDAVEIDPELTKLGRKYFDLRNPRMTIHTEDARPFLRASKDRYDAIIVDAYRQPYIPFYLTTREFFKLAHDRLHRNGSVVVNVGHPEGQNQLERVLGATIATEFEQVRRDPSEPTNTILLGTDTPRPGRTLLREAPTLDPDLRPLAHATVARSTPRLSGNEIYTDDRAPVEWLIDRSIVDYAAGD